MLMKETSLKTKKTFYGTKYITLFYTIGNTSFLDKAMNTFLVDIVSCL